MTNYKISENLAVNENGFLFMPNTGESYTVNETGREIIKMLREEKSEEEIIEALVSIYEVERETAERDFDEFAAMLRSLNLAVVG